MQGFANVQAFLETLDMTDVVTVLDEEDHKVVLATLDEAAEEQMDAYWRQVLNADQTAEVRDATVSSTLEFTEEDQKVQLTMISYLDDYLEVHADIPKDGLDKQNFCYSIEKI